MGVSIDETLNAAGGEEISGRGARGKTFVIPAREDLVVARETRSAVLVGSV